MMGTPSLVERAAEVGAVDEAVGRLAAGGAGVIVVEGPAGIGKTRVVAAARARAAEAGVRVLSARGGEMERDFPFGVVRQLFEGAVAAPGAEALLEGAAAAARPALTTTATAEPGDATSDASFAALHGLHWLTVNLAAERPLALVVDDLHWCDRPSLRFLAYLLRRLEGLAVLVVASLRTGEPTADEALIADVLHDPLTVRLRPAALTAEGTRALVEARLGVPAEDRFAQVCHEATGGNPLLLTELLAVMASERIPPDARRAEDVVQGLGPRAVSRTVLARLARLPASATAVARSLAVLGDGADLPRVAELAGVAPAEAARATGALARAEILQPDPPLGFAHPLVRAAVYHDLPPGEREHRHGEAARLLAAAGAPPEQVAAHLLLSPPAGDPAAVATLERAARTALGRGAADGAVAYLTRALAEPAPADRAPDLLFQLGMAESHFTGTGAATHLRAAYAATADPVTRARIASELVQPLFFTGDAREGHDIVCDAIAGLGDRDPDLRDRLEAWRLGTAFFAPDVLPLDSPEFIPHRRVAGDGPGARMLAGTAAYAWLLTGGSARELVPLAVHAVGGDALTRGSDAVSTPTIAGLVALVMADHEAADAATLTLRRAAHRSGSVITGSGAALFRGLLLLRRGDLGGADALLRDAVELQDAWGSRSVRLFSASYHGQVLVERGDPEGAARAMGRADMPPDDALPENSNLTWWVAARADLLAATGDLAGLAHLTALWRDRWAPSVHSVAAFPWRSTRARALHALGGAEEAAALLDEEVAAARAFGAPRALGIALRMRGELTGAAADIDEAVAVLDATEVALEHAKALLAQGRMLRLGRRPSDARVPLRRALELASACEAAPVAEAARAELQATGARPRTAVLSGVGSLTASERRVVDQAVSGRSNREIAEALYVTPKTVEVHLSSAYRKLGIRSRRELPAAVAGAHP